MLIQIMVRDCVDKDAAIFWVCRRSPGCGRSTMRMREGTFLIRHIGFRHMSLRGRKRGATSQGLLRLTASQLIVRAVPYRCVAFRASWDPSRQTKAQGYQMSLTKTARRMLLILCGCYRPA